MRSERFEFSNGRGHRLAALLNLPDGEPSAQALFAHCFTCGKDVRAASRIARTLAERGIATLRFDFTGLGGSEGEFANSGFSSNVDDLIAAAAHLRAAERPPTILIGHSLGGAAVLAAAGAVPEARAVATIGAPFDVAHVTHLFRDSLPTIAVDGSAEVVLAGRPFTISRAFVDDLEGHDQGARIARLGTALLVMHAPLDDTVGIESAALIFQHARHPKSFVSLDGADHLLTGAGDAEYAAEVLAAWASRYLGRAAAPMVGGPA